MSLQLVITNAGRAALVAAANSGTNAVTIAQIGVSGTAIAPTSATANLPGEVKRIATISGSAVAADTIHMIVRDESGDVFTVRSIALYLADGTLFAAYGQAGVIVEKSAQALLLLAIDVRFVDVPAANIAFGDANFLNPPATDTTPGVVELATTAETTTGTDDRRAVTPLSLKQSIAALMGFVWRPDNDGSGSGLDADTLDGLDASAFARITGATFSGACAVGGDPAAGRMFTVRSPGTVGILVETSASSLVNPALNLVEGTVDLVLTPATGLAAALIGTYSAHPVSLVTGGVERLRLSSTAATFSVPIKQGEHTVWHSGNDGSGSGLDADTLDGLDASAFARITGATFSGTLAVGGAPAAGRAFTVRSAGTVGIFVETAASSLVNPALNLVEGTVDLVLTPAAGVNAALIGTYSAHPVSLVTGGTERLRLSAAAATFSTQVAIGGVPNGAYRLTVNSTGSGALATHTVDAGVNAPAVDLIDGTVDMIMSPSASAGYAFVGTYSAHPLVIVTGTIERARFSATAASFTVPLTRSGNSVWDAGNDGAGSGLDADLLDGYHASAFARVTATVSAAAAGYRVLADGHKQCWGSTVVAAGATVTIAPPVAHTAWLAPSGSGAGPIGIVATSSAGFDVRNDGAAAATFYWHTHGV